MSKIKNEAIMANDDIPVAKSGMLIRKPVIDVFEALVNPEITSEFWFTRGSGRLEPGKTVVWEWEQFGLQVEITVTEIKPKHLIVFQWPADEEGADFRTVEITFDSKSDEATFLSVAESGFDKQDKQLAEKVAGQTEGWALVLSGMKAWLE